VLVPFQYRFWPHNEEQIAPKAKAATCKDPEQPIGVVELGSGLTALQHRQLLPQAKVLKLKHRSPPAARCPSRRSSVPIRQACNLGPVDGSVFAPHNRFLCAEKHLGWLGFCKRSLQEFSALYPIWDKISYEVARIISAITKTA